MITFINMFTFHCTFIADVLLMLLTNALLLTFLLHQTQLAMLMNFTAMMECALTKRINVTPFPIVSISPMNQTAMISWTVCTENIS